MSSDVNVESYRFGDNDPVPNNPALPLVIYRGALSLDGDDPAASCERLFARNGWGGAWRNGIYAYHHFHATTHEVLGVISGEASVRFGGEGGTVVTVRAGDVAVIPAGVAHKREGASGDLLVVGAYPDAREPDIRKGKAGEHPQARDAVAGVPMPRADPVFGAEGPLLAQWAARASGS